MATPINTDLPSSNLEPGVYIQIDPSGTNSADDSSKRVLVWGARLASGTGTANVPVRYNSKTDLIADHGENSQIAQEYDALVSQNGPGVAEVWAVGVDAPSGGTAATQLIDISGTATEAGYADVYIWGRKATVAIANGDTAAAVASALIDEINEGISGVPLGTATAATGVVSVVYAHKGLIGNDMPIRVDQFDASGLDFSAASLLLATNVTGAGTFRTTLGNVAVNTALAGGETPAAVIALVVASINAADVPVTAKVSPLSSTTLLLNYKKGYYCRRVAAEIITSTGTTINPSGQGAIAAGTQAQSGVPGAGAFSIATAITNVEALSFGFAAHVFGFVDPGHGYTVDPTPTVIDSTEIDLIYDSTVLQSNGLNQKPGLVFMGSANPLARAGDLIAAASGGPSPDLTRSYRFTLGWCPNAAIGECELAARYAGAYIKADYVATNLDGTKFNTVSGVPLLNPAVADYPSKSDRNTAMRTYFMTPIVVDAAGNLVILRAMTTSNAVNQDLREVSTVRQLDTFRAAASTRLNSLFRGKSYRTSTPKTPNTITPNSVKDALYLFIKEQDDLDLFDDAEAWRDAISVAVNGVVNTRFDVYLPHAIIRNLHQLGVVTRPV